MMGKMEKKCIALQRKMWHIFNEYGGYQYNDEMLCQLDGVEMDLWESQTEEDYTYAYDNVYETYQWFKLVKSAKIAMDKVEESMLIYC